MRPRRFALFLSLCLLFSACFEPAIRETLWLDFAPNGYARLTAEVELSGPAAQTNPAVKRRLLDAEQALLSGSDPWSERFARLEPDAERFSWEKRLGNLHAARRAAFLTEPEQLARFFDATDVAASYRLIADLGQAELTLVPASSSRAGRRERRQVEQGLKAWSEAVAAYLVEVASFYDYLEDHPEEQRACLGALYDDLLSEAEKASLPELSSENKARVDRLGETIVAVLEVLQTPENQEMSLDELSRLVFDPFPADLRVSLPGPALEVEGFVEGDGGEFEVPRLTLWSALGRLAGRWVSPDPATTLLGVGRQVEAPGGQPIPLEVIVGTPRRAASPNELPRASELRDLLEGELRPAPLYRATWAIRIDAEPPLEWRD